MSDETRGRTPTFEITRTTTGLPGADGSDLRQMLESALTENDECLDLVADHLEPDGPIEVTITVTQRTRVRHPPMTHNPSGSVTPR